MFETIIGYGDNAAQVVKYLSSNSKLNRDELPVYLYIYLQHAQAHTQLLYGRKNQLHIAL